jgi:hypothetical protein
MSSKKASDPGVLGSLPSTRPARLGRRREGASGTATKEPPASPKATARSTPKARPETTSRTAPKKPAARGGPKAVRSGAPSLKRPAEVRRDPPRPASPPRGAELVTTAVKATGELAQIGFTVGGQVLKRAVKRLPRP